VANYLRPGPSTQPALRGYAFYIGGQTTRLFMECNLHEAGSPGPDGWGIVRAEKPGWLAISRLEAPLEVAPVGTDPAAAAFERVLAEAGATLPARDPVDARVVREVRSRGGRIIDSQKDVGGWPRYGTGASPADGDGDGMPDGWETAHGLDPARAADGAEDLDRDGYTNLEEYLNGTDPSLPAGRKAQEKLLRLGPSGLEDPKEGAVEVRKDVQVGPPGEVDSSKAK
jgi:hypothetical protein